MRKLGIKGGDWNAARNGGAVRQKKGIRGHETGLRETNKGGKIKEG